MAVLRESRPALGHFPSFKPRASLANAYKRSAAAAKSRPEQSIVTEPADGAPVKANDHCVEPFAFTAVTAVSETA